MAIRDLMKLPVVGLLALAAACGGGESSDTSAATSEAAPAAPASAEQAPAAAPAAPATAPTAGNVVEVRVVSTDGGASGRFEPENVTVKKGDRIRWVWADGMAAHNVSFSMAQGNPAGFTPPADSPLHAQQGATFETDANWEPGTYKYVCFPHMAMGMVGSITVQ